MLRHLEPVDPTMLRKSIRINKWQFFRTCFKPIRSNLKICKNYLIFEKYDEEKEKIAENQYYEENK